METKKKVLLIVILIIAILGIGVCGFFLGKSFNDISEKEDEKVVEKNETEEKEEQTEEKVEVEEKEDEKVEEKVYTYADVTGVYTYTKKATGDEPNYILKFSLSDKGLFDEDRERGGMVWGSLGNYIIEGNKLKLYSYFETGSDVSVYYTDENPVMVLEINEDGSLTFTEDGQKIKLVKTNEKCPDNLFALVGVCLEEYEAIANSNLE